MTKGEQIKNVIDNSVNNNTGSFVYHFKNILQEELNSKLNFETIVGDIKEDGNFRFGQVFFKNEDDMNSVVDFTITISQQHLHNGNAVIL